MKSFKNYVPLTESKNTHMTHIEDLILDGGVKGARQAIIALRSLRDMLQGNAKSAVDVTVKWDGAPAVFAGEDPETGEQVWQPAEGGPALSAEEWEATSDTEEEAETVSTDTEIDSEIEAEEGPQPDEAMVDEQDEDSESNEPKDETTIVNEDLVPDVDEEKLDSSEDEPLQET